LAHVVVGLGNPGPEYRDTRHNIGQRVVDHLAQQLKRAWHPDARALVARGSWRGDTLYLVKPQTFMNVTGPAVRSALTSLGAGPEDLVLVYDDIDMVLGKVRTRLKGSAGGHNGVQSVIDALGTEAIRRVKIGIGRPEHKAQVPDHVLTTFERDEEEIVAAAVATAAERVLGLLARPLSR
jgi:peptidyl-tRNA hydrolase, PTH1 family